MTQKESIEYILRNVEFDFRDPTLKPNFAATVQHGYFFKTLQKKFYNFHGEPFGTFPTEIDEKPTFLNRQSKNNSKHIIHELEMLHCPPSEFRKGLESYIESNNYQKELSEDNLYFVIWYGWEGDNFAYHSQMEKISYAEVLNDIFKKYQIPRHKIIFLVSNLIVEDSLKKEFSESFEIWGDNWMEIDVLERAQPHKRKLSTTFHSHFKELSRNYEKPFIRANRTNNEDRDLILFDIFQRGMDDKFIFEHRDFLISADMLLPFENENYQQIYERIISKIPLIASKFEKKLKIASKHDLSNEVIPSDIYVRSPFSFVSTTFPYIKEIVFFHGSIFEPILNFHPFILNSNKGFLQHLRNSGYETYDNIFDEKYDLVTDDWERRISAVDSVEKIAHLNKEELLSLIFKSKEKIVHNRNQLIKCESIKRGHIRLAKHLMKYE